MDNARCIGVPRASEQAKAVTPGWEAVRVMKCARCGFYYSDPMPFWDTWDLQALYDVEYFGEESSWWRHVRTQVDPQRRLDAIAREIDDATPKLLDIGCGQGYLLEHALQRGWGVEGLEPSKTWAHRTATRLGVKVRAQRIEEADLPMNSYDVIFSDSVIEHLAQPQVMMELAWRVLRTGGLVYLVTPNADALVNHFRSVVFRCTGSRRSAYIEPLCSPYHVVGFTPHSLSVLADRSGFEVLHLWVRHGKEEALKEERYSASKVKSIALWPVLLAGELMGRGTTIDVLLIRR